MAIADEPGVDAGVFFAEVKNELMLDVTDDEDETALNASGLEEEETDGEQGAKKRRKLSL